MPTWENVGFSAPLFLNVKEEALRRGQAVLENCFHNEQGGQSRFPGLKPFVTLSGSLPVYLGTWKGDLIAVSGGQVYRIRPDGVATDVTDVAVNGDRRVTFEETPTELAMAAGGPIVRLSGEKTELLSLEAPEATHVGFIDGYLIAILPDSGLFEHSEANDTRNWDPIDTFAAASKPDHITGMVVTAFDELILSGPRSVEQFERLPTGDIPFFRRWNMGEGIILPYTLLFADNAVWGVNDKREFVRMSGQVTQPASGAIQDFIERKVDVREAWTALLHIRGQKFIVLQFPNGLNRYGTEGITFLFDYRQNRWSELYDWDQNEIVPKRWPGWSVITLPEFGHEERHFVGGEGRIFELDPAVYTNDGRTQRWRCRSAHIDAWGESEVQNLRIRVKRGVGTYDADATIKVRVHRDDKAVTRWVQRSLGKSGDRNMILEFGAMGQAQLWQFEYEVTDAVELEVSAVQALIERIGY